MDRRASNFSVRRVSELLSRVEQIEKQSREQAVFLQIQFKRIAQMQAELDHLRARNKQARRREASDDLVGETFASPPSPS
jgi:hypothetical protein